MNKAHKESKAKKVTEVKKVNKAHKEITDKMVAKLKFAKMLYIFSGDIEVIQTGITL